MAPIEADHKPGLLLARSCGFTWKGEVDYGFQVWSKDKPFYEKEVLQSDWRMALSKNGMARILLAG